MNTAHQLSLKILNQKGPISDLNLCDDKEEVLFSEIQKLLLWMKSAKMPRLICRLFSKVCCCVWFVFIKKGEPISKSPKTFGNKEMLFVSISGLVALFLPRVAQCASIYSPSLYCISSQRSICQHLYVQYCSTTLFLTYGTDKPIILIYLPLHSF